jgi:hypothetical protein
MPYFDLKLRASLLAREGMLAHFFSTNASQHAC